MGQRLQGRVAIVTGAGRGIGRAEALALAAEGARVLVNDLGCAADGKGASLSPADEVVEEIRKMGGEAAANYNTVSTVEGGEAMVKAALGHFGRLDILVNNAGILRDRMVFNMTEQEWDDVLKVHLYGHFHTTKPACIWFRQQGGGRIINTSSPSGISALGQANYAAAKEGIVGFTRTVARDMGKYGVTCNAIRPRAATRLTAGPELIESYRRRGEPERIAFIKSAVPEDVAPLVVFLAGDEAAGINGCVFLCGGGEIGIYPEPLPVRTIFKQGRWTVDELVEVFPRTLSAGLVNPAPKQSSQ